MSTSFPIVFPLFPGITQLDFTGPLEVLARVPNAHCMLASVSGGELECASGVTFSKLVPLADVEHAALLCVPGGFGTIAAMEDAGYIAHIKRLARNAQYVTSVCTGSLLLAAAGLLRGRRAACHWAWRDLLTAFGAIPDPARVVRDGNVITGGGVTAGIDMALTVLAEIAGEDYAQGVQLALEYAPAPPFDAGRPELARPEILATVTHRMSELAGEREAVVRRVAARLEN